MIVDCISDLHGHYPEMPGGDLLIVAGNLTATPSFNETCKFGSWLRLQKYRKKVVIAGNHDTHLIGEPASRWLFSTYNKKTGKQNSFAEYLRDSGIEFEGLKIWGSPWTKKFEDMNPECMAFTVDTEEELSEKWNFIPCDIDILITRSPPKYIMGPYPENVGSESLVCILKNTDHRLHVFGHVHGGYGKEDLERISDGSRVTYINASHVNERYEPVNRPVRIEL